MARISRELPVTKSVVRSEAKDSFAKGQFETFQALVMQALQLRKTYREVFILCDIRGYSTAETATILSINEDSVVRRLARARDEMGLGENGASAIAELIDF